MSELLFSYGTLRQQEVQLTTFGRELDGFELDDVTITDPRDRHPILRPSDRSDAEVEGTVVSVTEAELAAADEYEVDDYQRVLAPLRSGGRAWVYVFAG